MIEAIKEVFMAVGICVVGPAVYILLYTIIKKINRWRKNGCKIKCLCKPHVYEIKWYWVEDGEALLVCKKCGKRKQAFIDYDSIKENFYWED